MTKYLHANLDKGLDAECLQQVTQERDNRCRQIENQYQQERKDYATLNKLKQGYSYSCPTVVEQFAQAVEQIMMEQKLVRLFNQSYIDGLVKYIENHQDDEAKVELVRRVQEELAKRVENIDKYLYQNK